jgi:hypothetical protein
MRLNLLAGVQYRIGPHTITFSRKPEIGDPLICDLIIEIDGEPPYFGQPIPLPIAQHILRMEQLK